jgi:hypothetical protein
LFEKLYIKVERYVDNQHICMVYPIEIEIGEQRWSLLLAGKLSNESELTNIIEKKLPIK